MEFLKIVRRRSFLSEVSYIALNIALAISVVILVRVTDSPWLAIGLVLLSKWRVFAVRPRYWLANLQSNLVDYIVNVGFVLFLYGVHAGTATGGQKTFLTVSLMLLYMVWLIFIKPRSKRLFVVAQGGTALFIGITVIFSLAYAIPLSIVVALSWLIGYAAAKHILNSYNEESHVILLSQLWGLTIAEIAWIAYHWTIGYTLFGFEAIMVPRVALTVLCLGFVAYKCYDSYYHNGAVKSVDVVLPILFTFGVVVVLPIILNLLGLDIAVGV